MAILLGPCYGYRHDDQGSKVEDRQWHQKADMDRLRDPTEFLNAQRSVHFAITRFRQRRKER